MNGDGNRCKKHEKSFGSGASRRPNYGQNDAGHRQENAHRCDQSRVLAACISNSAYALHAYAHSGLLGAGGTGETGLATLAATLGGVGGIPLAGITVGGTGVGE